MKIDDERFELTPGDLASSVWAKLEKHLQERLAMLRSQNDGDSSERDTAKLRGRIAELKRILKLAEERPEIL